MKRIHWHWTAGSHTPGAAEFAHYHYLILGDGSVVQGKLPPEANKSPIGAGKAYVAHTKGANSDAIGIGVCAMVGAVERPFNAGRFPITPAQVASLARLTAGLSRRYNIAISRTTTLSHSEIEPTLGIKQRGKWDINWLPGMTAPGNPIEVGDRLRALVLAELKK